MNQTYGERVTPTDTVDDRINLITLALIELLTIINQGLPAIESSRIALTQSRNNILESKSLLHLFEDSLITSSLSLTTLYISIRLKAKTKLSIFLIADTYIHIFHQWTHDGNRLL